MPRSARGTKSINRAIKVDFSASCLTDEPIDVISRCDALSRVALRACRFLHTRAEQNLPTGLRSAVSIGIAALAARVMIGTCGRRRPRSGGGNPNLCVDG